MNILITGGSSGLGAAMVKALAADSDNTVYFTYSRSEAAARAIETAYANTRALHCDFTSAASLLHMEAELPAMDLDVLVNNANGTIHKGHFYKTDPDIFLKSFEHNILSTLRITQVAIKGFRKKKFGKIINVISSYVMNKPPTGLSEYVANKAYLLSMSKSWAGENIRFNISSNSISPSFMLTGLTSDTDERVVEQMVEAHPLGKLLTTTEVAETVVYLTKASQQINGTNIVINAGADM